VALSRCSLQASPSLNFDFGYTHIKLAGSNITKTDGGKARRMSGAATSRWITKARFKSSAPRPGGRSSAAAPAPRGAPARGGVRIRGRRGRGAEGNVPGTEATASTSRCSAGGWRSTRPAWAMRARIMLVHGIGQEGARDFRDHVAGSSGPTSVTDKARCRNPTGNVLRHARAFRTARCGRFLHRALVLVRTA